MLSTIEYVRSLSINDTVSYIKTHHWGSVLCHGTAKIIKINRYGHIILSDGMIFDKTGYERGSSHRNSNCHLCSPEHLQSVLDKQAAVKARTQTVHQIIAKLEDQKTGMGHYVEFSNEVKKELVDLINAL